MELFASSDGTASVTGSFIANDIGESMKSLRGYDEYTEVLCSEDHEIPQEELEGMDL